MKKRKEDSFFIVVADQDPDNQYLLQKAIMDQGKHDLSAVYNGVQLMDLLQNNVKKILPDFILLDLNMPLIDGFAVLTAIRANNRLENIPVFMLSSYNYEQEVKRSVELGADGFYTKPLQFHKLKEIVDDIFRKIKSRTLVN